MFRVEPAERLQGGGADHSIRPGFPHFRAPQSTDMASVPVAFDCLLECLAPCPGCSTDGPSDFLGIMSNFLSDLFCPVCDVMDRLTSCVADPSCNMLETALRSKRKW